MRAFGRVHVRILFLAVALATGSQSLAQRAVDDRPFQALDAPLASGSTVVLEPVTLEDGTEVVLEVSRVEPFTKGAEIVVHGPDGDSIAPLPSDLWFTGRVSGDPESLVMLARGHGLRGFILTSTRSSVIGPEGDMYAARPGRTVVRTFSPETAVPEAMRGFTCGTESLLTPHASAVPLASQRRPLTSVMYYAGIAIETDHEMYVKKGSGVGAGAVRGRSLRGRFPHLPARPPRDAAGELPFDLDDGLRPVDGDRHGVRSLRVRRLLARESRRRPANHGALPEREDARWGNRLDRNDVQERLPLQRW